MNSLTFENKAKPKKGIGFKIAIVLVILAILAGAGSLTYLKTVKEGCKIVTEVAFEYGRTFSMDDSIDSKVPKLFRGYVHEMIDDEKKEQMDIKKHLKEYLTAEIEEYGLSSFINDESVEEVVNLLATDITENAQYEIVDVKAGFTSASVTVHTSNVNYEKLAENMIASIEADITNPASDLWKEAGNLVGQVWGYLFGGEKTDIDIGGAIADAVKEYYQNQKAETERKEYTGNITYGFVDGSWKVTDIDKGLLNAYYGVNLESFGIEIDQGLLKESGL